MPYNRIAFSLQGALGSLIRRPLPSMIICGAYNIRLSRSASSVPSIRIIIHPYNSTSLPKIRILRCMVHVSFSMTGLKVNLCRVKSLLHFWQVRTLIDGQRQMRPGGKVLAPGGSSADLHTDQIRAGQVSSYSTAASNEPPAMPRTSEGAVSIEAKLQKPSDGQSAPDHRTGRSHGDQERETAVPHVTITTHPETSGKGESPRPKRMVILAQ